MLRQNRHFGFRSFCPQHFPPRHFIGSRFGGVSVVTEFSTEIRASAKRDVDPNTSGLAVDYVVAVEPLFGPMDWQADQAWAGVFEGTTKVTLDLFAGSQTWTGQSATDMLDERGLALSLKRLRTILVRNDSATQELRVRPAQPSNGIKWGDSINCELVVQPGGILAIASPREGWPVSAARSSIEAYVTTGQTLKMAIGFVGVRSW